MYCYHYGVLFLEGKSFYSYGGIFQSAHFIPAWDETREWLQEIKNWDISSWELVAKCLCCRWSLLLLSVLISGYLTCTR